jgi:hypothetical protein
MGFTNQGIELIMDAAFQGTVLAGPLEVRLVSDSLSILSNPANGDLADFTEVAASNGYAAAGVAVSPSGFGSGTTPAAFGGHELTMGDAVFTASGGNIGPFTGVLLADTNDKVIGTWTLPSSSTVLSGQTLTLSGFKLRISQ